MILAKKLTEAAISDVLRNRPFKKIPADWLRLRMHCNKCKKFLGVQVRDIERNHKYNELCFKVKKMYFDWDVIVSENEYEVIRCPRQTLGHFRA